MSLETDGSRFVSYEIRDDHSDGEQLVKAQFQNVTYTRYWHDNQTVTKAVADTEMEYRQVLRPGTNERIRRHNNESMTAIIVTTGEEDASDGQGLLLTALEHPGYEHSGMVTYDGVKVEVYEPKSGWFEASRLTGSDTTYRVGEASGVMYVDPETGQLLYANVSYDRGAAGTWGHYLVKKYIQDDVVSTSVTVEYHPGETDVERPAWATRD